MRMRAFAAISLALALSTCGGSLPPPDWKLNAQSGLEAYAKYYLEGNTRLADLNFGKSRDAIARSGRPDILARAELARCAARTAALVFEACPGYQAQAVDAQPAERAYAEFLTGDWAKTEIPLLPKHYASLLGARDDSGRIESLANIKDPQARLIGAALLFKQGLLSPTGIALAIETASERGWRRPLLAWLRVEAKRAEDAGDSTSLARVTRRIDLLLGSTPSLTE